MPPWRLPGWCWESCPRPSWRAAPRYTAGLHSGWPLVDWRRSEYKACEHEYVARPSKRISSKLFDPELFQVCTLLLVYNSAAWKLTSLQSFKSSSMATCIPNPESGLTFGKLRRSVDLTKKWPWNVWRLIPRVHRILITASNPIFLVKYLSRNTFKQCYLWNQDLLTF